MIYDVDYFIDKFEAIPEELWLTHKLTDMHGRHCALGHCGTVEATPTLYDYTDEGRALIQLCEGGTIGINDGWEPKYQQPTPKQRILAALRDIKEKIQKENNTGQLRNDGLELGEQVTIPELAAPSESKTERIVYVTVDEKVRELQKTLNDN